MAGFDNQPPASEFRKYTSYGKTRQPKNVTGTHGTQATVGKAGGAADAVPTVAADGHSTENQRFLHVLLKDAALTDDGLGIVIWAYSHAFGTWGRLTQPNGSAAEIRTLTGKLSVAQVFEISGVDRVYFQRADVGNATATFSAGNDELYAACSTF
jgi:hypothetical protein